MKAKTLEDFVFKAFEKLFNETTKTIGDDMSDIIVEVQTFDGITVRRSWTERNERLGKDGR